MNKNENSTQEIGISIEQILRIILTYILPILLVTVIAAGAAFAITKIFVKTKYKSEAQILIQANPQQSGLASTGEINAAKALIKQYSIILESDDVLKEVINKLDDKYKSDVSINKIRSGLVEEDVNDSGVLGIIYTDTDRDRAEAVVNAVTEVAPEQLKKIAKVGDAEVINWAKTTTISPKTVRNTILAAIGGFVAASVVFVLISMLDTRIRTVEDLSETFGITILGSIPTIASNIDRAETKKEEDDE